MSSTKNGQDICSLAKRLFPICRSITGSGVRQTLDILGEVYPIKQYEVPSGTQVFDWTVPKEWNIKAAWVKDAQGNKIINFDESNLHVVGYSTPINEVVSCEELLTHLYSMPEQPDLIPYVTSYYKERWGFCVTHKQRLAIEQAGGDYQVYIDSELIDGSLTYGEIILPGESEKEIFLSTYICHPSMANNELSGPCVAIYLAKWLSEQQRRKYTYRIVLIPETIGSITYLSEHLDVMKRNILAGFVLSCVGDDRTYSYVSSRYGSTLADKIAKNVLGFHYPEYKSYSFLQRGSDERQYCSPGVDLPVCSICRSKYGEYPEYHTSADDMNLISAEGLEGAFEVYQKCIVALENNCKYKVQCLCEPQLGRRGLYPTISQKGAYDDVVAMMDFIAYADGTNDLIDISNIIGVPIENLIRIVERLKEKNLIVEVAD